MDLTANPTRTPSSLLGARDGIGSMHVTETSDVHEFQETSDYYTNTYYEFQEMRDYYKSMSGMTEM